MIHKNVLLFFPITERVNCPLLKPCWLYLKTGLMQLDVLPTNNNFWWHNCKVLHSCPRFHFWGWFQGWIWKSYCLVSLKIAIKRCSSSWEIGSFHKNAGILRFLSFWHLVKFVLIHTYWWWAFHFRHSWKMC